MVVELDPELVDYVDEAYKEHLKSAGNIDQLADVDVISGIELYIERGQWDKALQTAQAQDVHNTCTRFAVAK